MGHGHDHHHSHGHAHHGHCHTPSVTERNRGVVGWAAVVTGLFVVVEVAGGLISGSLALLADAGHMVTDFAALAMAWAGFRLASRAATPRYTFGFGRVTILVAFINGLTLFAVAGWIVWEAVQRLREPGDVLAGPMFWVAVAGLLVNIAVFALLMRADRDNLNIRGAMLHVLGDLLGSAAAVVAAVLIWTTGWVAADPILSVLVALLILRSAWGLLKDSAHVLLEGAPQGLNADVVVDDLKDHVPGLVAVESIHAWSVTPEEPVVTLRAVTGEGVAAEIVGAAIRERLQSRFGVDRAVVEVRRR